MPILSRRTSIAPTTRLALAAAAMTGLAAPALAGGSPENALIIVNPGSAESMYLGNYYKNARNIPDRNVLYMDPAAASYVAFSAANGNLDGLFGYLKNAGIDTRIDYVIVAGTGTFFIPAPGYVTDGCSPVSRFSQSAVYTMAFLKNQILAGSNPVSTPNHFASSSPTSPRAFSSNTAWLFGNPDTSANARRYFIGAQLGYTGTLGNTLPEVLAMIDRSVAADATRPGGTFYFMNTTDPARNVRSTQFAGAISAITGAGGAATQLNNILPDFQNDCLGILTGWPDPNIDGSIYTIVPGAFCDHLTSWAATFDNPQQTKMSAWIRRGASGTAGEVEEPCNYTGKFPAAALHAFYYRGLSLGEAYFRSIGYVPFQGLFIGDPLTRPYATFPTIVPNAPSGTVNGVVSFTPSVSTSLPGAVIAGFDVYVDGVYRSSRQPGDPVTINTVALADGVHDVRILAYDNTVIRNTGRWVGQLTVSNFNRSVGMTLGTTSGDLNTFFQPVLTATGGTVREVRLLHNGRVVAAANVSPATLKVYGNNLGAGQSTLQAEALFTDGTAARSEPITVNISYTHGTGSGLAPIAYSYTKRVARGGPFVVELPARFDDDPAGAAYTILAAPGQGTTVGAGSGPYRVMTATNSACGTDQFTFRVTTPSGQSNVGTVTLIYGAGPACPADYDGSGQTNVSDFIFFQNGYAAGDLKADIDGSCTLNINDFIAFLNAYAVGCP